MNGKGSKFSSFLKTAGAAPETTGSKGAWSLQNRKTSPSSTRAEPKRPERLSEAPGAAEEPPRRGPGRPRGKRSDPAFTQTTVHLRIETLKRVKISLIEEGQKREFSELVEDLLTQWLSTDNR